MAVTGLMESETLFPASLVRIPSMSIMGCSIYLGIAHVLATGLAYPKLYHQLRHQPKLGRSPQLVLLAVDLATTQRHILFLSRMERSIQLGPGMMVANLFPVIGPTQSGPTFLTTAEEQQNPSLFLTM